MLPWVAACLQLTSSPCFNLLISPPCHTVNLACLYKSLPPYGYAHRDAGSGWDHHSHQSSLLPCNFRLILFNATTIHLEFTLSTCFTVLSPSIFHTPVLLPIKPFTLPPNCTALDRLWSFSSPCAPCVGLRATWPRLNTAPLVDFRSSLLLLSQCFAH